MIFSYPLPPSISFRLLTPSYPFQHVDNLSLLLLLLLLLLFKMMMMMMIIIIIILKASRRQDSSERYRALSYCNHLAQDTDFV